MRRLDDRHPAAGRELLSRLGALRRKIAARIREPRISLSSSSGGASRRPVGCVRATGGQRGFTLVEIIVALAILALCLSVLLRTISDALWHTSEAEAQAEAASIAGSLLAQAGSTVPLRDGEAAGQLDNGFRWRLRMDGYGGGADLQSLPVRAYRVTAEVFWNDALRERSVALTTLRLGPNETTR